MKTQSNPETPMKKYLKYGIKGDLEELGFRSTDHVTPFGSMRSYYREESPNYITTLMIHGVSADSTTWAPLITCAADSPELLGNILLIDLPGYGASENIKKSLWIPEVGTALMQIAHDLNIDKMRLFGHSMGGFLALDMASRFNQVTSVHVAAGSYFAILNTIKQPMRNIWKNPRTAILWDTYWAISYMGKAGHTLVNALAKVGLSRQIADPFLAHPSLASKSEILEMLDQLNSAGIVRTARNGPEYDAVARWGSIQVPLVAVFGTHDPLVTEWDADLLRAVNPKSTTVHVENSSHMLIVEQPCEALHAMLDLPRKNA